MNIYSRIFSRKKEVIVGIGGFLGHDANAALIVEGQLIAANQEERFSRIKHDNNFPEAALEECLGMAGLCRNDVTVCVFAEKPLQSKIYERANSPGSDLTRLIGRLMPEWAGGGYNHAARVLMPNASFHYAWHHLSHAVGAYYSADFSRAAFLCIDGKGEECCATCGVIDDKRIHIISEQAYSNGLGMLYALVTLYLGFESFGSEYKVMGLAPYGKPRFTKALGKLFSSDDRGGLQLFAPLTFDPSILKAGISLVALATGVSAREKDAPLEPEHVDIAASLQTIFEEEVLKMANFVRKESGENNLLLCGGCAQNCVAAGRIRSEKVFDRLFNSPVGGDMGSGLGAALLYLRNKHSDRSIFIDTKGFYLGSEPGSPPSAAAAWRISYKGGIHGFIAAQLAEGKTVGWVRGRMELGARALGARSILADPRQPGMQSRLNIEVKFRESFRPFAPAILAEYVSDWFDSGEESNYMNYTARLLPKRRRKVPQTFVSLRECLDFPRSEIQSVVHVDFSARLQTIDSRVHPDFHKLLSAFKALTGIPLLINTSFNVSGEPIVRTAGDAWTSFLNTDLDLLVINDSVFSNPRKQTKTERQAWVDQFSDLA